MAHEILDRTFMMIPFRAAAPGRRMAREAGSAACDPTAPSIERIRIMKWETPEAVDFRFGMEITMYVANR
jgi:coenzyme PQQ precursor peptide PqqA